MVVHCVYCGCCEIVCAGGCGLGLYLYNFGHSCACDTRIIGLWWLTCLQWPSLPRAALFDSFLHSFSPRRSAQLSCCAVHLPLVIAMSHSWLIAPIWSRFLCGNAWLKFEMLKIVGLRWLISNVWPIKLMASLVRGLGSICLINRQMWYHNCGLSFICSLVLIVEMWIHELLCLNDHEIKMLN